jgi:hypothetical protein
MEADSEAVLEAAALVVVVLAADHAVAAVEAAHVEVVVKVPFDKRELKIDN